MKKVFTILVTLAASIILMCSCSANRGYYPGRIVNVDDDIVTVEVAGHWFDFDGEGYTLGEHVTVEFTNGHQVTNVIPWTPLPDAAFTN